MCVHPFCVSVCVCARVCMCVCVRERERERERIEREARPLYVTSMLLFMKILCFYITQLIG
jgi:hypothetical protein